MKRFKAFLIALLLIFNLAACQYLPIEFIYTPLETACQTNFSLDNIPQYSKEPYVILNGNVPYFEEDEITDASFEYYSELDYLGRCGVCIASIGEDIMPTEKRKDISMIKPTGWQSVRYEGIDGESLYNRCHLIGHQLTGENANEKNLITGTRYLNTKGMLPFENMVDDYIEETKNHVMYRVTPVFSGDNLIADGVVIEAYSVEDAGDGISFCVYCYNVQPGIDINYADGTSKRIVQETALPKEDNKKPQHTHFVLNTSSKKFHSPTCSGAVDMKEKNKKISFESAEELIDKGYTPCGACNPE